MTTKTMTATATMFIAHGASLQVFDPARNNGIVVVTTLAQGEVSVWQDGGRNQVVSRKRHHLVYDSSAFVALEVGWGYQKLTGQGWDWWGRMIGIATALAKGAGGAIATSTGGGAVEVKMILRKRELVTFARLVKAVGLPCPIANFEAYLEGVGYSAGVAEYHISQPGYPGDTPNPTVLWVCRSTTGGSEEKGAERNFSARWECDGRNVFVRDEGANDRYVEPLAVLPAKWFEASGGSVEIRLGSYAEHVSGEGYDRKVTAYPDAVATIEVAKYDASATADDE